MPHPKVFFQNWLSKASFERKFTDVAYTLAQTELVLWCLSHMVSCDWPVRNVT